jgi:uncharacterized protein with PQ loop repeat
VDVVAGVVGVALSWGLAGSQWWRAGRSPAGISVLSWAVFLAVNATWLAYGIGVRNPYLAVNGLGAGVLNVALLRRIDPRPWRTCAAVVAAAVPTVAVGVAVGWAPVAWWCVVMAAWLRWPQLAELVRAPDVAGVSLASWVLAAFNNVAWIAVGLQRDDPWLVAANVVLGLSSLAVVGLCLWRRTGPEPVAPATASTG